MKEPIITYSVKPDNADTYTDTSEYYAGTYTRKSPLRLKVRIWNNKYGTEEVESVKDFALKFYFGSIEDAVYIKYLTVKYDNVTPMNIEIVDDIAFCTLWEERILSGKVNNGKESDKVNYLDLLIELDASDSAAAMKNLDLKSLYIEVFQQ